MVSLLPGNVFVLMAIVAEGGLGKLHRQTCPLNGVFLRVLRVKAVVG
jgi:hypothetical protein